MDDIYCSFCGSELNDGDSAYGLTGGVIDGECEGFRMDCDDAWDIYCGGCMNKIDRLLAVARKGGAG